MGRFGGGPAGRTCAADERRRWEREDEFGANAEGDAVMEGPAAGCGRSCQSRGWWDSGRDSHSSSIAARDEE